MFKPRVSKAAMLYKIDAVMVAGTAVRQRAADGFLEVAPNGTGAIGFLAASVRDWTTRTEKEILFPQLFFGQLLSPEWINQPHVTSPLQIGVRIGAGYEYEVQINDALVPGDKLIADAAGQLMKQPVGNVDPVLAIVKDKGLAVGLPLDYAMDPAQRVYMIRTLI
jgi:hypothetical protein